MCFHIIFSTGSTSGRKPCRISFGSLQHVFLMSVVSLHSVFLLLERLPVPLHFNSCSTGRIHLLLWGFGKPPPWARRVLHPAHTLEKQLSHQVVTLYVLAARSH